MTWDVEEEMYGHLKEIKNESISVYIRWDREDGIRELPNNALMSSEESVNNSENTTWIRNVSYNRIISIF